MSSKAKKIIRNIILIICIITFVSSASFLLYYYLIIPTGEKNVYADLREAISKKFLRDNGLEYKPEQIVVSTGAKQSIYQVVMALINPGDEVIIPTPFWVSYKEIVKVAEGKCVYVPTKIENDFKVTPQQLEEAITPRTKLIMFSSPSNPTGMLYTKEELKGIAEVLERHPNVFVMADEIYEHINFEGKHESLAQFPSVKEQVITVNGVAKGFAMTGWRIGWICGNKDAIKQLLYKVICKFSFNNPNF